MAVISRYAEPTPLANLHLTLLEKVGVRLDAFADSKGKIAELLKPLSVMTPRALRVFCLRRLLLRRAGVERSLRPDGTTASASRPRTATTSKRPSC